VLADAVPRHTRRFTNLSGGVSGRYIGALALASQMRGTEVPQSARVVDQLLGQQKPDGHYGNPLSTAGKVTSNDMAIMWGNGRLLIGLMEYRVRPHPNMLATARKLGDVLVSVRSGVEGIQRREVRGRLHLLDATHRRPGLWQATKDDRYLTLARALAERTDRHPSQHRHGYLTSLRTIPGDRRAEVPQPGGARVAGAHELR
jgi:hypothetical protein